LEEHPFVAELMEQNKRYLHLLLNRRREMDAGEVQSPIVLSPREFYASDVIEKIQPLVATLDRMRWSLAFLRGFPNARSYERQGITRDKWMEYHYSSFIVAYSSFRDLSLLLINQVFRLGIPARLCSKDAVLTNTWVKETEIPGIFRQLEKLGSRHQEVRNRHVHRGQTPDLTEVLENPSFRHISTITFVSQIAPDFVDRELLMMGYRLTTEELRTRMNSEIDAVVTTLDALLTGLHDQYEKELAELAA
jgi:hypothetical protein